MYFMNIYIVERKLSFSQRFVVQIIDNNIHINHKENIHKPINNDQRRFLIKAFIYCFYLNFCHFLFTSLAFICMHVSE